MSMKLDREGDRFSNAMCLEPVPAGAWSEEGEALSSSYLPCCRALFHHGRCGSYERYSCDAPEANEEAVVQATTYGLDECIEEAMENRNYN